MRLIVHPGADAFLRAASDLERREAENSLVLGSALALRDGSAPAGDAPYLATVRDGAELAAAALHRTLHPLLLATGGDEADAPAAMACLAADLLARGRLVPSAVAPAPLADAFADVWGRTSGHVPRVEMRQRLHALAEVETVAAPPGWLRRAGPADLEVVGEWMAAFDREALGEADLQRARAAARRRVAAGEVYLWDDDGPRAMAARSRPTRHTAAVNAVYTPPELRGRGYASGCVAALSRLLLDGGRRLCVLFTDLANPTSNAVYARIGYRPVCDFTLYRFGDPA